jgi:hypothetical protein
VLLKVDIDLIASFSVPESRQVLGYVAPKRRGLGNNSEDAHVFCDRVDL